VYDRGAVARRSLAQLALAPLLAACGEAAVPTGEYVAIERDFAGFDAWTRFDRGAQPVGPSHPDGETFVYANHLPPRGSSAFPVGTILVRMTRPADPSSDPSTWEVHAMAKRGGGYNDDGALGWEYFDLQLEIAADGSRVPRIRWRGEDQTTGDGYTVPDGGVIFSCDHCHATAVDNDFVLGPELDLDSL
jgi:hypothetical protein